VRRRASRPAAVARVGEYSDCGRYRYLLRCRWADGPAVCVFVCLNPTVDISGRAPTVTRAIGFARDWGYDTLHLVNLYALMTDDPRELVATAADPFGPDNDRVLLPKCSGAALVVAAWGAFTVAIERVRSTCRLRLKGAQAPAPRCPRGERST
jgi:hypothetical protein